MLHCWDCTGLVMTASSRKSSGLPRLLQFKGCGGHRALGNLKCPDLSFATTPMKVQNHLKTEDFLYPLCIWPALILVPVKCVAGLMALETHGWQPATYNEWPVVDRTFLLRALSLSSDWPGLISFTWNRVSHSAPVSQWEVSYKLPCIPLCSCSSSLVTPYHV